MADTVVWIEGLQAQYRLNLAGRWCVSFKIFDEKYSHYFVALFFDNLLPDRMQQEAQILRADLSKNV